METFLIRALQLILSLSILVLVHEFGHFITARMTGVKVNEFSLGMGPAILKKQGKKTLYSLRVLPIGGYCAMEGETEDSDDENSFRSKSVPKRILICAAGAAMNIILGFILMLVTLIGDIIRLSQLDEGNELPCEEFDLMDIAEEVGQNLESAAGARDITLSLSGRNAIMYGVRRLMYEIVYNLCDNAIKYNLPGGKVEIMVDRKDEEAVLCVKDNGIGIAPEHQDRVFERFYRVDKSHSKSSGGTGLGLSIVKHAVQYHHGKLELKSEIGKGTEITVHFPIEADK